MNARVIQITGRRGSAKHVLGERRRQRREPASGAFGDPTGRPPAHARAKTSQNESARPSIDRDLLA